MVTVENIGWMEFAGSTVGFWGVLREELTETEPVHRSQGFHPGAIPKLIDTYLPISRPSLHGLSLAILGRFCWVSKTAVSAYLPGGSSLNPSLAPPSPNPRELLPRFHCNPLPNTAHRDSFLVFPRSPTEKLSKIAQNLPKSPEAATTMRPKNGEPDSQEGGTGSSEPHRETALKVAIIATNADAYENSLTEDLASPQWSPAHKWRP